MLEVLESRGSIRNVLSISHFLRKITHKIQTIIDMRDSNKFFSGTELLESIYKSYIPKIK